MKNNLFFILIVLLTTFLLIGCNDEEDVEQEDKNAAEPTEEVQEQESEEDTEISSGEETIEDQRDLTLGDTGTFETTLGTYEVTLHSAEIVGSELDGEPSLLDELIVLELTFKNIGDNIILAEEIMHDMEITENLEASGYSNGAEMFDSIDVFEGEIQPGEEKDAQFIGDIYTSDEYFFGKAEGNVAAGTSNQVIWTISDDEARN